MFSRNRTQEHTCSYAVEFSSETEKSPGCACT